jgi:hypothetical protein
MMSLLVTLPSTAAPFQFTPANRPIHFEVMDTGPEDDGGLLSDYVNAIAFANGTLKMIKISGRCYSACTMFLGAKYVCLGENARLFFHSAATIHEGERKMDEDGTEILLPYYNEKLRTIIKEMGLLDSLQFQPQYGLGQKDLVKMGYKAC